MTYLQQAHDGGELPPEVSTERFMAIVKSNISRQRLDQDLKAIEAIYRLAAIKTKRSRHKGSLHFSGKSKDITPSIVRSGIEISKRKLTVATHDLEKLITNKNAPAGAYLQLADLLIYKKKYDQAEKTIDLGIERIGRDYRFLPVLIRINKLSKDIAEAEECTIQCKKYDDTIVISLRDLGITDKRSIPSYYQHCCKLLGYDVLAKQKKDQPRILDSIPANAQ